jgi:hypothetical protein
LKIDKHRFIFVTDLTDYADSYRQAWTLWLDLVGKDKEDYSMNMAQAMTHLGIIYVIQVVIVLTEQEFDSFQEMT